MKKIYLTVLLIVVLLTSCSRRHKSDSLHYFNDFESVKGWSDAAGISSEIAGHSGNYSLLVKPGEFSYGFYNTLRDISKKQLKKIRAVCWCYSNVKPSAGGFIIQITNPANENKLWAVSSFVDFMKTEKKWTRTVINVDVPQEALNPENRIKIFLWNQANVPVYGDDFEIEFTE